RGLGNDSVALGADGHLSDPAGIARPLCAPYLDTWSGEAHASFGRACAARNANELGVDEHPGLHVADTAVAANDAQEDGSIFASRARTECLGFPWAFHAGVPADGRDHAPQLISSGGRIMIPIQSRGK